MSTKKFLDQTGLAYLWQKIRLNFVSKESGKGLSTNDYTTAEKNKLAGIAAGATANIGTVQKINLNESTDYATADSSGALNIKNVATKATINGVSVPVDAAGNLDLGTVIRAHQDISGKVDKETGKGLSENDFTTALKTAVIDSLSHLAVGTCATAGSTAAKVVNLSTSAEWTLEPGRIILVKFSNTNTANSPTINVNSTGAKSVFYDNGALYNSNLDRGGYKNRYIVYMYDGTYWVFVSWGYNKDTTYPTLTLANLNTGTATVASVITAKILNDWLAAKNFLTEQVQADWNTSDNSVASYIKNKPTIPDAATIAGWGFARTTGASGNVAGTVTSATINGVNHTPDENGLLSLGAVVRAIYNGTTALSLTDDGKIDLSAYFATKTAFDQLQTAFNTLVGDGNSQDVIDTFNEIKNFLAGYDAAEDTLSSLLSSLSSSINSATAGLSSAEIDAAIAAADSNS